jgi:hypothetical protein
MNNQILKRVKLTYKGSYPLDVNRSITGIDYAFSKTDSDLGGLLGQGGVYASTALRY